MYCGYDAIGVRRHWPLVILMRYDVTGFHCKFRLTTLWAIIGF